MEGDGSFENLPISDEEMNQFNDWLVRIQSPEYRDIFPIIESSITSSFFATLKQYQPEKWQKAVKELTKAATPYL